MSKHDKAKGTQSPRQSSMIILCWNVRVLDDPFKQKEIQNNGGFTHSDQECPLKNIYHHVI